MGKRIWAWVKFKAAQLAAVYDQAAYDWWMGLDDAFSDWARVLRGRADWLIGTASKWLWRRAKRHIG